MKKEIEQSDLTLLEIGNRIQERRKELNLTLQEVADIVGVASSTIQRYEKGLIAKMKLPVIESIAKAINVNPTWLIKKDAQMTTNISDELYLKTYKENIEKNTLHLTINLKPFTEYSRKKELLISYFDKLNVTGMDEAIKRVSELTEINKYIEDNIIESRVKEKESKYTLAAHDDNLDSETAKKNLNKAKEIFKQMDEE
ncbi:helix-turn-helix transcriptional regulator [Clostridium botulinum]|uniref:helix-turn-helix domain-containing protein n=1 Tax=Clostridium TaxID=1485 RepID=UPI000540F12D|nr:MULTISPECIES: helix-turn-helix transcriptional regulator [Clostridium]AIY81041.1 helix-turn-helix family protein [Clostridium botulinum 202F]KAI3347937.1 helix-turn-helix domain-containing protein [Clostridium botulinum]KON14686.1 transcriptional regulator, Cro/CI family protein [Clostridium botulinum]MBN1059384.1 XRE family transcriptional regulator [Clostridium botulinum]MBY6986465.1 helix-turn-helix transcriptional regulator [Clostridium botulinum]